MQAGRANCCLVWTTADLSAVAQRYVLNHPRVACTIPGFRNERQVACSLAAA